MMSGDVFSSLNPASAKFFHQEPEVLSPNPSSNISKPIVVKKRRNLPGTPDPDAEVIALSPKTLMATDRFFCEICNKGFRRDQNLQLHRRGHNLPWKLKQRANKDQIKKKVYICPENTCVHHDPSRALGDLTGIKKHFSRKHGEKKWKCEKCSKKYAVQSDWKAHSKTCGTREYKCDCGTLFSRKDSFITHRAFCDALAEENSRISIGCGVNDHNFRNDLKNPNLFNIQPHLPTGFTTSAGGFRPEFTTGNSLFMDQDQQKPRSSLWTFDHNPDLFMPSSSTNFPEMMSITSSDIYGLNSSMGYYANLSLSPWPPQPSLKEEPAIISNGNSKTMVANSLHSLYSDQKQINHSNYSSSSGSMSATALLQKAAQMGSTKSNPQFFGSTTGVMLNSSSPPPPSQNRSELHRVFSKQQENGLAGSAMNFNSSTEINTINNSEPSMIQTQGTSSRILHSDHLHGVSRSLTRDFLGMGGYGGDVVPFLPQQLAKFASIKSGMGMNHSTDNNQ
ncbi:zinc finger protein GAI-ASSOCIATED FACTOR 1-like [Primulina huaijiensis]|uniref:zinc finger protein GAI-ASSOCIATED FACTOR 1-like n=1 Tax=Primulina huaijiensis TaxID=1492673 RepID=UPI003CC7611A